MIAQFKREGTRKSFGMSLRGIRVLSKSLLLEWDHRVMEKATRTRLEDQTNLEDQVQAKTLQDPDHGAQPIRKQSALEDKRRKR